MFQRKKNLENKKFDLYHFRGQLPTSSLQDVVKYLLAIMISPKSKTKSFLIWLKNDNLNLNFGDDDLKDALVVGDDDPDCI